MFKEILFPGYVRLSRAGRRASRRTSERGRLIQIGMMISMIIGLDTGRTLAYQLFAFLVCMVIISRLTLKLKPPAISVRRLMPGYATADETFEYYITVTNEGDHIERDLRIEDNPRVVSPTPAQYRQAREPGEETRNAWDRWIGYHRFIWLQRRNTGVVTQTATVTEIPLKASVNVKVEGLAVRRGVVHFESTTVFHSDPFGMNYGVTEFDSPCQLLVLPKRYRLSGLPELHAGRHFQPGGVNPTWSIGESDEFVALREYRDGDSPRKIHWPSTAKRDKPVVKEFQDEYFVRQALVLDTALDDGELLEEVIAVAASFVFQMDTADTLLDLVWLHDKVEFITAGRGYAHSNQQLEALATAGAATAGFDTLREAVVRHARLLSGCILILGDWDESRRQLVDNLTSMNIPTATFVVRPDDALEETLGTQVHLLPIPEIRERLAAL